MMPLHVSCVWHYPLQVLSIICWECLREPDYLKEGSTGIYVPTIMRSSLSLAWLELGGMW